MQPGWARKRKLGAVSWMNQEGEVGTVGAWPGEEDLAGSGGLDEPRKRGGNGGSLAWRGSDTWHRDDGMDEGLSSFGDLDGGEEVRFGIESVEGCAALAGAECGMARDWPEGSSRKIRGALGKWRIQGKWLDLAGD